MDVTSLAATVGTPCVSSHGGAAAFVDFGTRVVCTQTVAANSIIVMPSATLAASGTDYWTLSIGVIRAGVSTAVATRTTAVTGFTALTPVTITNTAFTFQPGDIVLVAGSVTGSPAALAAFGVYLPTL